MTDLGVNRDGRHWHAQVRTLITQVTSLRLDIIPYQTAHWKETEIKTTAACVCAVGVLIKKDTCIDLPD